jgi:hypothetical protein
MKENDLRRLIIKLLSIGALEETFVSTKNQFTTNVAVYLSIGSRVKSV